ncbi:hypothetical protein FOL47_001987 [Perkinsus chesapeaki]|uniref:Uncharacterized protein n=1 Tax=Perkinsus chesapeaki TaxID=330153 RepID=A0A7J6MH60_PERCH|nr:hypothetical protein FOL47_001987 [Perkinsus chesapeaki]
MSEVSGTSINHTLIVRVALPALQVGTTLVCDIADDKIAEASELVSITTRELWRQLERMGSVADSSTEVLADLEKAVVEKAALFREELQSVRKATVEAEARASEDRAILEKMREDYFREINTLREELSRKSIGEPLPPSVNAEDICSFKVEDYPTADMSESASRLVALAIQEVTSEFKLKYEEALGRHSRQLSHAHDEIASAHVKLEQVERRCRYMMSKLGFQKESEIDKAMSNGTAKSNWNRARDIVKTLRASANLWAQIRDFERKVDVGTDVQKDLQPQLVNRFMITEQEYSSRQTQTERSLSPTRMQLGLDINTVSRTTTTPTVSPRISSVRPRTLTRGLALVIPAQFKTREELAMLCEDIGSLYSMRIKESLFAAAPDQVQGCLNLSHLVRLHSYCSSQLGVIDPLGKAPQFPPPLKLRSPRARKMIPPLGYLQEVADATFTSLFTSREESSSRPEKDSPRPRKREPEVVLSPADERRAILSGIVKGGGWAHWKSTPLPPRRTKRRVLAPPRGRRRSSLLDLTECTKIRTGVYDVQHDPSKITPLDMGKRSMLAAKYIGEVQPSVTLQIPKVPHVPREEYEEHADTMRSALGMT